MIRDFIPEDEQMTPEEERMFRHAVRPAVGGVTPDFVPDSNTPPTDLSDPEAQRRAAEEALERSAVTSLQRDFDTAVKRLQLNSASSLIDLIRYMSDYERNLQLIVERETLQRPEVLDFFADPDARIRERLVEAGIIKEFEASQPSEKKPKRKPRKRVPAKATEE